MSLAEIFEDFLSFLVLWAFTLVLVALTDLAFLAFLVDFLVLFLALFLAFVVLFALR